MMEEIEDYCIKNLSQNSADIVEVLNKYINMEDIYTIAEVYILVG